MNTSRLFNFAGCAAVAAFALVMTWLLASQASAGVILPADERPAAVSPIGGFDHLSAIRLESEGSESEEPEGPEFEGPENEQPEGPEVEGPEHQENPEVHGETHGDDHGEHHGEDHGEDDGGIHRHKGRHGSDGSHGHSGGHGGGHH